MELVQIATLFQGPKVLIRKHVALILVVTGKSCLTQDYVKNVLNMNEPKIMDLIVDKTNVLHKKGF